MNVTKFKKYIWECVTFKITLAFFQLGVIIIWKIQMYAFREHPVSMRVMIED